MMAQLRVAREPANERRLTETNRAPHWAARGGGTGARSCVWDINAAYERLLLLSHQSSQRNHQGLGFTGEKVCTFSRKQALLL